MMLDSRFQAMVNYFIRTAKRYRSLAGQVLCVTILTVLLCATLYGARFANQVLANNSDAILFPYLFSHFHTGDVILPQGHGNILKFPLFFIQSALPYNLATFKIVGIGLSLATIGLWIGLFGRRLKYSGTIVAASLLSAIILASPSLNNQLYGTTIRNIEYPIAAAFVFMIASVIYRKSFTRLRITLYIALMALFAVTVAGDSLIMYQTSGAIGLGLALFWFAGSLPARKFILGLSVLVTATLCGLALKVFLVAFNIVLLKDNIGTEMRIVDISSLSPSITTALKQTLDMFGANVFGKTADLDHAVVFFNLVVLIAATIFLAAVIKRGPQGNTASGKSSDFILCCLALTFFVTFALYILSNQVVVPGQNGGYSSAGRERYLTILPFLAVTGLAYGVRRRYPTQAVPFLLGFTVLGVLLISNSFIRNNQHAAAGNSNTTTASMIAISEELKRNNVHVYGTGYWHGASVRFYSTEPRDFFTLSDCNVPAPDYNIRFSWYKPSSSVTSKKCGSGG